MTEQDRIEWTRQFAIYVDRFRSSDRDIQQHMDLKADHTAKVVKHCRSLAAVLGFTPADTCLCQVIGLWHDLGRFQQYTVYRTFNDSTSVNHAELALSELKALGWLESFSPSEQEVIEFAVGCHNAISIPTTGSFRQIMFAKIVRDADKLDIYRVLQPTLMLPDQQGCTPQLLETVMNGGQSSYTAMKTPDDRKLVRLSWVYDVNFSWTIQQIMAYHYIDIIFQYLPDTAEFHLLQQKFTEYMQERARQADRCE